MSYYIIKVFIVPVAAEAATGAHNVRIAAQCEIVMLHL